MGALTEEPKTRVDRACHRLVLQDVRIHGRGRVTHFPQLLGQPSNVSVAASMRPHTAIAPSIAPRRPRRAAARAVHERPVVVVVFMSLTIVERDETDGTKR